MTPKITGPFCCYLLCLRFTFRRNNIWIKMAYFTSINQRFAQIFQRSPVLNDLQVLFERNYQRFSHWDKRSLPRKSVWHIKLFILQKMKCIGFKDINSQWFQSFLSNRKYFVTMKDVFSDTELINNVMFYKGYSFS